MAVNKTTDKPDTQETGPTDVGGPNVSTAASRRLKYGANVAVLLLATLFIVIAVNWLAAEFGARFDLTKSRRYSLSPQTQAILDSLEQPVTITLLFSENDPSLLEVQQQAIRSARAQVQDVLEEFTARSDDLAVERIDPTDPSTIDEYDALITRLRESKSELFAEYEASYAQAQQTIESLKAFVETELGRQADMLATLDREHPQWQLFRNIYQVLSSMPVTLDVLARRAESAIDEENTSRPLPDWEGVRLILAEALQEPATTFREVSRLYRSLPEQNEFPDSFEAQLGPAADRFQSMASNLENVRDALRDLPAIDLQQLIRQIMNGNCVLLSDGTDTDVLPFNRLFPTPSAEQAEREESFDRRFAGERVISAAIRRLTIKNESTVVICHAEPGDPLRARTQDEPSLQNAVQLLRDLGFDVQLWNVTQGERPEAAGNDFADPVWIIMPPRPTSMSPQASPAASQLATIATNLIESGERVMMNVYPSTTVGFGQPDFWNDVLEPLGLEMQTDRVIYQQFPQPNDQTQNLPITTINRFPADHLLASALNDLDTLFTFAVPILLPDEQAAEGDDAEGPDENDASVDDGAEEDEGDAAANDDSDASDDAEPEPDAAEAPVSAPADTSYTVIADIQPTSLIWAETDWMMGGQTVEPPSEPAANPYHVAVAIERGTQSGTQRSLVIGAASWFDDAILNQRALTEAGILYVNPGNTELFRAGVCWLAGLDELVAPSPMAQSVSRISGLSDGEQTFYRILLMALLPLGALALGIVVWYMRRG